MQKLKATTRYYKEADLFYEKHIILLLKLELFFGILLKLEWG